MITIIEAVGITFIRNTYKIIKSLNFSLKRGGCLILFGSNGSGKSTLLRLIVNFIPLTLGAVWFYNNSIFNNVLLLKNFHLITTLVDEKPELRANFTIKENLNNIIRLYNKKNLYYSINYVLNILNLSIHNQNNYNNLSQGQQRKLTLSKLLLVKKRIWILDEPITNLDKKSIKLLEKIINIHRMNGGIVIIATHSNINIPKSVSIQL